MRHRYLVCYDIANPKRLTRIAKVMRGFGARQQYSIFQCDLSARERVDMIVALSAAIHHREDRVMIVDMGPADGRGQDCVEYLGVYPIDNPIGAHII